MAKRKGITTYYTEYGLRVRGGSSAVNSFAAEERHEDFIRPGFP